jgi:hypothetical protein
MLHAGKRNGGTKIYAVEMPKAYMGDALNFTNDPFQTEAAGEIVAEPVCSSIS